MKTAMTTPPTAGADSVDITSDNQMSYDEGYAAGEVAGAASVVAVVDTDEDGYDDGAYGWGRLGCGSGRHRRGRL